MKKLFIITFILLLSLQAFSQVRSVSGNITDAEDGSLLPGVSVLLKGTSTGASTDFDGNFQLDGVDDSTVLIFSFLGYSSQEITVGSQTVINISLSQDATSLDEVIVTALGITRETKSLGFAAQKLDGEDLSGAREVSITNYLTGKIAGVQVSNSSAGMGGTTNVTIRGNGSLTGSNQPLYVVDGVPIINEGNSGRFSGLSGENDYGDGISNINPDDVETMTVLKGPAASALYGSRGANGVIVITTKSGKSRRGIGVEINSTTSIQTLNLIPTYQNKYSTGYEGTNLWGRQQEIDGTNYETLPVWHWDQWGPPLDGRRVVSDPFLLPGEAPRTLTLLPQPEDNIRDFYNTGVTNNNMIALSGGNENTTARLSFANTNATGIIPNSSSNRNSINLRVSSKLSDKLSFDAKVNYINNKFNNRPNLGASFDNVVLTLATFPRYVPLSYFKDLYEATGELGNKPGVRANPYYVINELKNNDQRNRMIAFASLRYQFTDWLSLSVRTGMDWYTDERMKIWPVGARWPNRAGRFTQESVNTREWNSDFLLTANKELTDSFSGSFSVGGNLLKQYSSSMRWDARDLKVEDLYHVSNAEDVRPSNSLREKEIQSLFFMGQLAYKDYLFLDFTGRNDWSSTLGVDNFSFFYPSVGMSLVFSDALNLKSDVLTFGKIRASWAQVGNDSDPYLTQAGYNSFNVTYAGQGYASIDSVLLNPNLKNELTETIEFGIDVRMFKNRLGIDLTYYNGNTKDQIIPIQISNASGFQRVMINAGEIKNSGFEAVINAGIFRKKDGFSWDMAFNFSNNESEVVSLAPGIDTYPLISTFPNSIEARVGEEFGNIIGFKYKTFEGRRVVGSGGAYERESEISVLGNINPDWIGGLNNSFKYKGFFMNVLVDFVQGGEMSSGTKYRATAGGFGKWTEEGRRPRDTDDNGAQLPYVGVLDGVVEILDANNVGTGVYEENTQAVDGQSLWAQRAWRNIGEEFVIDASYITLREVMLGYNVNQRYLKNTGLNSFRVTLIGRNLFYFQESMQGMGISPESAPNTSVGARGIEQLSMPTTRSWAININLSF